MNKLFLIITLVVISTSIFAVSYQFTVNLNNGLPNDYDSISDALNSIPGTPNVDEDAILIEVYPDYDTNDLPIETVFYDKIVLSGCTTTLKGIITEGFESRDYIIIDSYDGENYNGSTAITVQSGSQVVFTQVLIDGFTIRRSGFNSFTENESGIVCFSNNINVANCTFGTRNEDNNFFKSIYYWTDPTKGGNRIVGLADNIFEEACNLGEYTIVCSSGYADRLTYNAIIHDNQFVNCGKGMKIINSSIFHIDFNTLNNTDDFSNRIDSEIEAINASSPFRTPFYSYIDYNEIDNFEYGIVSSAGDDHHWIRYNEITNTTRGINSQCIHDLQINNNLVHTKFLSEPLDESIGIFIENIPYNFSFNTIVNTENEDNTIGIRNNNYNVELLLINSSIIWNFDIEISQDNFTSTTLEYCCLENIEGQTGIIYGEGNIDDDPIFVDPDNLNFELTWIDEENHSPCIDTADPDANGNGSNYLYDEEDRDIDGSRKDMGCFPYRHEEDTKYFYEGIQWLSFPMLDLQLLYDGEYPPLIGESYEQAYSTIDYDGLLQDPNTGFPTITGFLNILGYRGGSISIIPVGNVFINHDEGFDNMLFRHEGYKIEVDEGASPTVMLVGGEQLDSYSIDMNELENYWLGYYLEESQNIEFAFGDFWADVNKVWAEDWYYDVFNMIRGGDPNQLSANSTKGKTMEYGKMYIVQMYDNVDNFSWYGSSTVEEPTAKAESQYFTYTEKADYEAIDVVSIPSNVMEIGVFEEEVCVGAVVVEDSCAQILVYSDSANRDPIPFTFEVVTGRGFSTPIKDYLVLNQMTGEFEPSVIISGRQGYSAIRFEGQEEFENIIAKPVLNGNYPNPFNPTTTISFSLPNEQDIELTIYNIKGQKVKTLYSGIADEGEHTIIWEGKNTNNKQVSSGIYFYKLKTGKKEMSRKMLLLK